MPCISPAWEGGACSSDRGNAWRLEGAHYESLTCTSWFWITAYHGDWFQEISNITRSSTMTRQASTAFDELSAEAVLTRVGAQRWVTRKSSRRSNKKHLTKLHFACFMLKFHHHCKLSFLCNAVSLGLFLLVDKKSCVLRRHPFIVPSFWLHPGFQHVIDHKLVWFSNIHLCHLCRIVNKDFTIPRFSLWCSNFHFGCRLWNFLQQSSLVNNSHNCLIWWERFNYHFDCCLTVSTRKTIFQIECLMGLSSLYLHITITTALSPFAYVCCTL